MWKGARANAAATLADISKIRAALGWAPRISFTDAPERTENAGKISFFRPFSDMGSASHVQACRYPVHNENLSTKELRDRHAPLASVAFRRRAFRRGAHLAGAQARQAGALYAEQATAGAAVYRSPCCCHGAQMEGVAARPSGRCFWPDGDGAGLTAQSLLDVVANTMPQSGSAARSAKSIAPSPPISCSRTAIRWNHGVCERRAGLKDAKITP